MNFLKLTNKIHFHKNLIILEKKIFCIDLIDSQFFPFPPIDIYRPIAICT